MAGTITPEDRAFVETWEHISAQRWGITRLDARGDEKSEIVAGRRTFMCTSEERMITQDRITNPENDPFLNGSFRPVIVPDAVTIASNPNALSDEEILSILNSESELAWNENLSVIDSVATLRRMIDMSDQSEISVKRFRQLELRLKEVRGEIKIDTNDPALKNFLSDRPKLSDAGEAEASRKRGGGGRSRDYRDSEF